MNIISWDEVKVKFDKREGQRCGRDTIEDFFIWVEKTHPNGVVGKPDELLNKLRRETGQPIYICEKALFATNRDFDESINWIRKNAPKL